MYVFKKLGILYELIYSYECIIFQFSCSTWSVGKGPWFYTMLSIHQLPAGYIQSSWYIIMVHHSKPWRTDDITRNGRCAQLLIWHQLKLQISQITCIFNQKLAVLDYYNYVRVRPLQSINFIHYHRQGRQEPSYPTCPVLFGIYATLVKRRLRQKEATIYQKSHVFPLVFLACVVIMITVSCFDCVYNNKNTTKFRALS